MNSWKFAILVLGSTGLSGQTPELAAPPSTVAAPVTVDLAPMFALAERSTPRVPPGVETWMPLPGQAQHNAVYRFNLYRDPLLFNLKGNHLSLHTQVNYWFEVAVKVHTWMKSMGKCGLPPETFRRARLGLQADLNLTPDWNFDLRITPEDPLRIDGCAITFLGMDITNQVLTGMKDNLARAAGAVQQQIRDAVKLRPRAEEAWAKAQEPVELAPGVWMTLNPERVRLGPWSSQDKTLTVTPEIQVRPTMSLGAKPAVPLRPLPPLDLTPLPVDPGFHLQVNADLSFEHAAKQFYDQLGGKPLQTDKGTFEITKVGLRSKDGVAYLDLDLKGKVKGRLTLKGRPVFHEDLGILRLEDLDYTLETKSLFASFGEWLYRGSLHKLLTDKCAFFLDKSLKDVQEKTRKGLNRSLTPRVDLTGQVDALKVARVDVLADRFKVLASLDGKVQLAVRSVLQ